jgi:hypothetical protein
MFFQSVTLRHSIYVILCLSRCLYPQAAKHAHLPQHSLCLLAPLRLCVKEIFLCAFAPLCLCVKSIFRFAVSADHSRASAEPTSAADTRERLAALSGFSRTPRVATASFQRFLPCFPPASAAVKMTIVSLATNVYLTV